MNSCNEPAFDGSGSWEEGEQLRPFDLLVRNIASRVSVFFSVLNFWDDLYGAGLLGLMKAARRYKSSRGASFRTYASFRIRGEMIDQMRSLGRVSRYSVGTRRVVFVHLDANGEFEDECLCDAQALIDHSAPDPRVGADFSHVASLVGGLPEKQRKVVALYYGGGLSLKEVGRHLNLSESWASYTNIDALAVL